MKLFHKCVLFVTHPYYRPEFLGNLTMIALASVYLAIALATDYQTSLSPSSNQHQSKTAQFDWSPKT
jgi:hypothetical protein